MLTSEFLPEMGALIRRLEGRVRNDRTLLTSDGEDLLHEIEDALVVLCVLYLRLERAGAGTDV